MRDSGVFSISLDFELYWGTRDQLSIEEYGDNLSGVRVAVPAMLAKFVEHHIHATWAVVGFVLFDGKTELLLKLPSVLPEYACGALDPYSQLNQVGENGFDEQYFFAADLVRLVASTPDQEIASHTYSHYYCLEDGQTEDAFEADLAAMREVVQSKLQRSIASLVFPRNQTNARYLALCSRAGMRAYRGNPTSWLYMPRKFGNETLLQRGVRLADAYLNLTGHNGHDLQGLVQGDIVNVPASRFLRPWSRRFRHLEWLRLRRILSDMTVCAKTGKLYHLWWHPENFGTNTTENLEVLERVLAHYQTLARTYGMQTLSMGEVAQQVWERERSV